MSRFPSLLAQLSLRALAALQIFVLVLAPACVHPAALEPTPGVLEYRAPLEVAVPGAVVDVAGGNLVMRRTDLSIDTQVGEVEIGAVYNSTSRAWIWPFEATYDGVTFVDATGAVHDMATVAPGEAVPGTHWVKVDATHVKTKGGLVHAFDAGSHRLERISWGVGALPELVYDVAEVSGVVRVVGLSQCDALGVCRFVHDVVYDANGCVARIRDRAGRVADFVNDAQCRPLVARDGLDVAEGWAGRRYTYDAGLLDSMTTSEGERTAYVYLDGRVVLARQVDGAGGARLTRFEYGVDPASGLHYTLVHDARGGSTAYRYDDTGRLHARVDAVGDEVTYTWSGRRPTSFTDAAGSTTTWGLAGDDVVSMTLPSGNSVAFTHAPDAHDRSRPYARPLHRVTDALGLVEERIFDGAGRLQSVENGAGDVVAYAYHGDGMLSMILSPDGTITWLEDYGEHGHPRQAIRSTYTDHRQYDAVGNQIEGADLRGPLAPGRPGVRRLEFDADRNVARVERVGRDTLGAAQDTVHDVVIDRRSDGRIAHITRPYGGETEFVYDGFGDLVEQRERVDGAWCATRFERDGAGAPTSIELANGLRREFDRDAIGRVVGLTLVEDGAIVQTMTSTYAQGRLAARLDSARAAPEAFAYDAAGRVSQIVFPDGEVVDLVYDARSRETGRTYRMSAGGPVLRTIERVYDGAGRELEVRDDGVPVLTRSIAAGRVDDVTYANGLVRRFDYEPTLGLLVGTRTEPVSGGPWIEETRIDWSECVQDSVCVTTRADIPGDPAGVPPVLSLEGYRLGPMGGGPGPPDPLGRAGSRLETYLADDAPSSLAPPSPEYAFDALGNWLGVIEAGAPRRAMQFNAERNRLLAVQGSAEHTYGWDEAGYLTHRDGVAFDWSPNGRPTAIGTDVSLSWDALGRPISATIDGVTTRALFGADVIADAAGTPLQIDLGEVVIDLVLGERFYRHHDFRGNVQLVTDAAGAPVLHHSYGPFGATQSVGQHADDQTFAGGSVIGDLVMLGARLYDPAVGRFLSPDPVFHVVNQFAYTLGNPVFLWDPSGEHAEPGGSKIADIAREVGELFLQIGLIILAAGISTGNLHLSVFGGAMATLGAVLKLQAEWMACGNCRVQIIDGPFSDPAGPRRSAGGPVSDMGEVTDAGCSPTAITGAARVSWSGLAVVGAQLVLAAALAGRFRRRRTSARGRG